LKVFSFYKQNQVYMYINNQFKYIYLPILDLYIYIYIYIYIFYRKPSILISLGKLIQKFNIYHIFVYLRTNQSIYIPHVLMSWQVYIYITQNHTHTLRFILSYKSICRKLFWQQRETILGSLMQKILSKSNALLDKNRLSFNTCRKY
jgi:hypothetical protein